MKIGPASQRALLARLRRAEGQLRGIARLIEQEADCEEIARQMAAARHALDRVFYEMLACGMERRLDTPELEAARPALTQFTRLLAKYG